MSEEIIEGVIELAPFREINKFEIEFLKKVSQNIATTITATKVNQQTKQLYEQSQGQAEEMRQNMEDSNTQEEMERQSHEFIARLDAVNSSGVESTEFDLDGSILEANHTFCETMGYVRSEIIGKHHSIFLDANYAALNEDKAFWKGIKNGQNASGTFERYNHNNEKLYFLEPIAALKM